MLYFKHLHENLVITFRTGTRNGLAALLRRDFEELVVTHCLAHRLELAFRDVMKQVCTKLYDKAVTLLLGLHYMFHKSPKQKKQLDTTFEILGINPVTITRIGGTRWLPHLHRAIDIFFKGYKAFHVQLHDSSHGNPKAEGLAKLMTDMNVVIFIITVKEVITPLMRLSKFLQRKEISLADGMERVNSTVDVQHQMSEKWVLCLLTCTKAIELIMVWTDCNIDNVDIDGLVQERCNSSALAMELYLSCTDPSICNYIHGFLWGGITHPGPNFCGGSAKPPLNLGMDE